MSGPPYWMTVIGLGAGFMLSHARYCVWEGSATMAVSRLISLPVSGLAVLLLPVMLSLGGCASPDDGETKTYYPEKGPYGTYNPAPSSERDSVFGGRSEEHTSELQSLMRTSYAVFCLKKKTKRNLRNIINNQ